jgi:nicotinate phosphoribosyltransferase
LLPDVTATIECMANGGGVLGGVEDALAYLRHNKLNVDVWALDSGAGLKRGDVALRLRGAYRAFGPHVRALAGMLAAASGWTTAARELVEEAKPSPVIFRGAANVYPAMWAQLERAAVAGGCLGADAVWNRGLLARDVILLTGDTVRALGAFDELLPPDIPRLVWVDLFHDEADEAVRVALAMGDALGGIVLPVQASDAALTLNTVARVRSQLELAGFPRVKIFLDGDISLELLNACRTEHVALDGYFVGEQIGSAPPLSFAWELRERNAQPLGRRGQPQGTTPSLRLKRIAL